MMENFIECLNNLDPSILYAQVFGHVLFLTKSLIRVEIWFVLSLGYV